LRRRAAASDGRVSTEWNRCPDSMARCPRDSVPPLRRTSAGWIPASIGRLSAGVGRRHPVTIRKASLMVGSIRRVWILRHQTEAQYSAVEWTWVGVPLLPIRWFQSEHMMVFVNMNILVQRILNQLRSF